MVAPRSLKVLDVIGHYLVAVEKGGFQVGVGALPCPLCRAPAGEPCRWRDGAPQRRYHRKRGDLAETMGKSLYQIQNALRPD